MTNYIELPVSGLEGPLTEMEQTVQDATHRFARDVLRPAGTEMDAMSAEDAIADGSILWEVLAQAKELGLKVSAMAELEPAASTRLSLIAGEELAWGDVGLAGMILVDWFPPAFSTLAGREDLVEYCEQYRGCWGITEPDHGTDMLDPQADMATANGESGTPNCVARIEGDYVVINGQKSAWVSGAMTAELCVLYCHAEADEQTQPGICVLVPLDLPGVSRGKPLEKFGARAMNQGELFFDGVQVPITNLLARPDTYNDLVHKTLTDANVSVGNMAVGIARAAYEHALAYAHERVAGGQKIIKHQNVQYRLFHMFRKVEAARALVRRAGEFNATAPVPALHGSTAAKVTATQTAFEVASDALQIFGANGLTKEYPMEKLVRDARSFLIADGCNEMLALKGGAQLINPNLL
ncbi:MAG: acyl-CoA dehydrogenase [Kiritimatiellia bacterium]|jgi:alkylation response protein AidB-like acyl-CoA dehydrogenase|nr:acyl-CoA dehydrogenase [Pseudomonadales bacterium]MDP6469937.1 acyl-CoA dehydrogenase [Pseudomonadales bacterium]MDP6828957.1 acyl-CoA dehydrogenase [Pseudomonadales bacterium]MDP7024662.1 acyl-CoA dehydrogenase [Kiritimatiellia bacterium]|tara:strand:- start:2906 stop:4135 length:1230 start_codon:yes stop_codon:yes gene_type:complete